MNRKSARNIVAEIIGGKSYVNMIAGCFWIMVFALVCGKVLPQFSYTLNIIGCVVVLFGAIFAVIRIGIYLLMKFRTK